MPQNREAVTDNKARTARVVKSAVSYAGGSLSKVLYQFVRKGVIGMQSPKNFTDVLEEAINIGAEDVTEADEGLVKVLKHIWTFFSNSRCSSAQMMLPRKPKHSRTWATISRKSTRFGSRCPTRCYNVTSTANKQRHYKR